jgi:hypothetical protein
VDRRTFSSREGSLTKIISVMLIFNLGWHKKTGVEYFVRNSNYI